jgi:hypothetical protein
MRHLHPNPHQLQKNQHLPPWQTLEVLRLPTR